MHDASYTEVSFDGYKPRSFLQTPGAMDVGMEFHSLSKSYNMTGWRLGVAVGNSDMINALMVVKSNLDSGVPQAIQYMGIEALDGPLDAIDGRNAIYQRRRDRVMETLRAIGLHVDPPKAGLYVWARNPAGLHLRRSHRYAAGTVRYSGHTGQRLRQLRGGLHSAFAHHRRRGNGEGPGAPRLLEDSAARKELSHT